MLSLVTLCVTISWKMMKVESLIQQTLIQQKHLEPFHALKFIFTQSNLTNMAQPNQPT